MSRQKPKYSVKIIGCKDLMRKGLTLTANPYVKLKLGPQPKRKTGVIDKNINPIYNTWCDFPAWPKNDILVVSVWSFNTFTQNEFLGQLQFECPKDPTGKTVVNQPLRPDAKNTEVRGSIQLEIYEIDKHKAHVAAQKAARAKESAVPLPAEIKGPMAAMRSGDKMVYYDGQQPRECLLWHLESTSGGLGYIVWTARVGGDPRAPMSSRHTLPVSTLKKICVGDACPHAAYTPEPDLCLSLQGSRVTHNLTCGTEQQRDDWLAGIKYILESRGKTVKNQEAEGGAEQKKEPDAADKKKKGRKMTVDPNSRPMVHAQPSTPSATAPAEPAKIEYCGEMTEQIKSMVEGVDVIQYSIDGSGNAQQNPIRIVFSKTGGKYGSLCWQEKTGGGNKKLLLHECTDIYVGKQQDIFKCAAAENVDNAACLSIVDKHRTGLHIQFPSGDILREWMIGVNKILTSTGSKVLLEEDDEEKAGGAGGPDKLPEKKGRKKDRHFSVAVKKEKVVDPDVLAIGQGAFFTRFRQKKSRADRSVKTEIFVFQSSLVDANGRTNGAAAEAGGLYWYEKSDNAAKSKQWIAINTITDIFTGKQHEIFKNRCASDAVDEHVMSIRGCLHTKKGQEQDFFLHLEAENAQQIEQWVRALTSLLQSGGRVTTEDKSKQAPVPDILSAAFADAAELDKTAPESEEKGKALKKKRISVVPPNFGKPQNDDPFAALVGGNDFSAPLDMTQLAPQSRPENPFQDEEEDPFADREATWDAYGATEETDLGNRNSETKSASNEDPFDDLLNSGFAPAQKTAAPAAAAPAAAGGSEEDELSRFLGSIGLSDVLPALQKEEIDMATLKMFTPDDLKDIGLAAGPRVKIIRSLPTWTG